MYSERVKLTIDDEIDGFQKTTLIRLLSSFETIEMEALQKRQSFLDSRSKIFDPDFDDEACIEEDGFFEEMNHILIENSLKQEFLNSASTWLFHLFERQKMRVLGTHMSNDLKPILLKNNYDVDSCPDWRILNKELRFAANAIKHGKDSGAMIDLSKHYSNLIVNGNVVITKTDIERYLIALRVFWSNALDHQVVL